ncbi:MAG: 50S ribosomal protein L21 [Acidobacteriota bacterium]
MFAVISTGGKQYKVKKGDIIEVEKLNANEGDAVEFDNVLMIKDKSRVMIGKPILQGAKVSGVVMDQKKGKKIIVFKKKRKKQYRRTKGHRQLLTSVKIEDIISIE